MKSQIKRILISIVLILVGAAMAEMALTDPEFETGARVFMVICALPLAGFGIWLGRNAFQAAGVFKKKTTGQRASDIIRSEIAATLLPDFSSAGDESELQRLLSGFRENYRQYFFNEAGTENAAIQNNVTQIFLNRIELQGLRLKAKQIKREFISERKCYGNYPVRITKAFDGKYEIMDICEDIAAKSTYTREGRKIFSKISAEVAHYTTINAKQVGEDAIICPNCGTQTDRTSLLDGCDYCAAKFTVEDLGVRISDFTLRKNAEVEYQKYRAYRRKLNLWVGLGIAIAALIPCIIWTLRAVPSTVEAMQVGPVMVLLSAIFTSIFPAACAAFLGVLLFDVTVLPALQASASTFYIVKKQKETTKAALKKTSCTVDAIRRFDPLFSFANFCSGVENKLAAVIFAESEQQANAFYAGIGRLDPEHYSNVIDFEVLDMDAIDYGVAGNMQRVTVDAVLNLIAYDGLRCRSALEKLRISLAKSADCRTQAVCAPAVMTCEGCGASRSLLDGRECPYCGRELELSKYDWVITDIQYRK